MQEYYSRVFHGRMGGFIVLPIYEYLHETLLHTCTYIRPQKLLCMHVESFMCREVLAIKREIYVYKN